MQGVLICHGTIVLSRDSKHICDSFRDHTDSTIHAVRNVSMFSILLLRSQARQLYKCMLEHTTERMKHIEAWWMDYNRRRPHSSLGYLTNVRVKRPPKILLLWFH